ncbi:LysR family transcriptional regulator [Halomonas salipaludis]|uniref:LysR family transcriptional regulator n=1 Tax=Halomonas salipaludis TaxID=2032625 RepID=A0A2A2ERN2_9GAMM|nr:LysR family transcriptional regulator [Halomonas salipaludis]PAU75200.1 LysR family transcriptional regulator [Halomonas salipaludis]
MKLDTTSLKLFVRVAEKGTIAGAAEAEFIATSAVSKRISELEEVFNTPLLLRTNKGVELTAAGIALLNMARGVLHNLDDIFVQMREYSSGLRGNVRVYANMSAITQYLPGEIQSFFLKHPEINIHLEEKVSPIITREVASNGADVGVCALLPHGHDLETFPYHTDDLVVVTPLDHPLAVHDSIRFDDTLGYAYVGLQSASAINLELIKASSQANRPLNIRIQVTSYDALCLMVEAGLGIGVVPRGALRPYAGGIGIKVIALRDEWARRKLAIFVNSFESLPMAARLFVEHLVESSKKMPSEKTGSV